MRFLKHILNGYTVSILLSIALSVSLFKLQQTSGLIAQRNEDIKKLSRNLSEAKKTFDDLTIQHGALQTESRRREGELLKALQEAEAKLKQNQENPPAETTAPSPDKALKPKG